MSAGLAEVDAAALLRVERSVLRWVEAGAKLPLERRRMGWVYGATQSELAADRRTIL